MESSGGHQPWHYPTLFFDSNTNIVRAIDSLVDGPGVGSEQFQLSGDHEIEVRFNHDQVPHHYSLVELVQTRQDVPGLSCSGGRRIR
jgi:hypothetical protein